MCFSLFSVALCICFDILCVKCFDVKLWKLLIEPRHRFLLEWLGTNSWSQNWTFCYFCLHWSNLFDYDQKSPKEINHNSNSFSCHNLLDFRYTVNIYKYKTIQARVNTVAIPTIGKYCSLYWELLHPKLGIPLASIVL